MSFDLTVRVHVIAEDGLPDVDRLTGRVAFLFDGCIVSGWPLRVDPEDDATPYSGHWVADTDVGHNRPFGGVTHWVEFPASLREVERQGVPPQHVPTNEVVDFPDDAKRETGTP